MNRRYPLLALGLLLALPARPAATRDEIFNRADADRAAERYTAALAGYDELLKTEPRNGHLWVRRAVTLHNLNRNAEAVLDNCRAHLAFVVGGDDKRARAIALTNRADSAASAGDLAGAFADSFAASKVDPTYARAFVEIADSWFLVGNLGQANAYLAMAQQLDSTTQNNYTAEGAERNSRGKVQPTDGYDITAQFNSAVEAYNRKDYAECIAIYDRILARQPLNDSVWGNRGNALKSAGRTAEAIISQSRAAALCGSMGGKMEDVARHFVNRLNCWLDLDDIEMAILDGEIATRAYPDGVKGWQRLATAWFRWGDLEKAQGFIDEAKKRDPEFKGYSDFSEDNARANKAKRLVRLGDRSALPGLVEAAEKARPGMFEENLPRNNAIAVLDALLKTAPRDVELLLLRARAEDAPDHSMKLGTEKSALPFVDRALELDADNGSARLLRALLRLRLFDKEDEGLKELGWSDLDRAIELGAGTAEAFTERGRHFVENKNPARAAEDFSAALKLSPDDVGLLRERALAYGALKRWPEAFADHNRRIELALVEVPQSDSKSVSKASATYDRAEAYATADDLPRALADYSAAIALKPQDPDYFLGRARIYRLQGDKIKARADLVQARKLDDLLPEIAADGSNAETIEELRHDMSHGFKRLARSLKDVNDSSAELLKAQRRKDRAEAKLRRLLVGDDRTPEKILEEVEEAEQDGTADADDYRDRARAMIKLKRIDDAVVALDKAIELKDDNAGTRNQRGRIHESRKEYDAAFADYDRAVALDAADADFRRDRGDIWWERKNFEKAYADYDGAVTYDVANADNWFKRGNAQFMLGHFAEAIADYDKTLELAPGHEQAKSNRDVARRRLPAK